MDLQQKVLAALTCVTISAAVVGCSSRPAEQRSGASIREESITFQSGDVRLAGTLVLPSGANRHPGVVLFHGSGPEPRNLEMARWFAAQGITALTYDKRGVGQSAGDFRNVPFMDLHVDGLAGVSLLKHRRDIDSSHVGVWGLSQGGWLGPLAASRSRDISFVIAVSGPGISPGQQMVFYYANQLRAQGVPEPDVQAVTALRQLVWHAAATGENLAYAKAQVDKARATASDASVQAQHDDLLKNLQRPKSLWFAHEMNYDPVMALRQLTVPSLFLFGDDDQLVPIPRSIEVIQRTLKETHHPDFTIKTFRGADHTIHIVGPGGSRQFAPGYLSTMRTWLLARVH